MAATDAMSRCRRQQLQIGNARASGRCGHGSASGAAAGGRAAIAIATLLLTLGHCAVAPADAFGVAAPTDACEPNPCQHGGKCSVVSNPWRNGSSSAPGSEGAPTGHRKLQLGAALFTCDCGASSGFAGPLCSTIAHGNRSTGDSTSTSELRHLVAVTVDSAASAAEQYAAKVLAGYLGTPRCLVSLPPDRHAHETTPP